MYLKLCGFAFWLETAYLTNKKINLKYFIMTRRDFIYRSAILGAGASLSPMLVRASGKQVGANDKIRVGLIGCNGMGFSNLTSFLRNSEVECIALADIDQGVLDRRAAEVEKIQGKKPKGLYKDWRHLIDNKEIGRAHV